MQSSFTEYRSVCRSAADFFLPLSLANKALIFALGVGASLTSVCQAQVATPRLSPSSGGSAAKIPVTVSCTGTGLSLYYTTDGQTPTQSDDQIVTSGTPVVSGTVMVGRSMTLKVKAWNGSGTSSAVASGTYAVTGMVATGVSHSLALRFDGAVYAWGDQTAGALGNGSLAAGIVSSATGVLLKNTGTQFFDAVDIAAGTSHSLILDANGVVWATGANSNGQLGISSTTSKAYAEPVWSGSVSGTLNGIKQVSAGHGFSLALTNTGSIRSWGAGAYGRLGNNGTADKWFPVYVLKATTGSPTLTGVTDISAGKNFAGAVDDNGKLWTWGYNNAGQLGIGSTTDKDRADKVQERKTALNIVDMTDVSQVAAGEDHLLLVRSGTWGNMVWACGQQEFGALGNGNTASDAVIYPHEVLIGSGTNLTNITQIDAGAHISLALDGNRNVWAWGKNDTGAVGDGTNTNRAYATRVKVSATTYLSNIVWISAGGDTSGHCLAIDDQGKLYAWGNNSTGMLASGTTSPLSYATWTGTTLSFTNKPPTGSLSVSGTLFSPPATVTLTATASDPEGAIFRVRFYQGSTLIATDTTSPYSHQVNSLSSGTYSYSAIIQDGAGATVNTGTSTVVVSSLPTLSVSAVPTTIAETSGTSAVFRISATPTGTSALTVGFSLSGSATNGADYQNISTFTAVLATGSSSVAVPVTPLADGQYESNENVVFTIASGTGYTVGSGSSATLTITQSQPGAISKNGGDAQVGAPEAYLAQPLSVLVQTGTVLQQNAPVVFTVTSGSGGLALVSGGTSPTNSLTAYTGSNGVANVYYKQGPAGNTASTITAQSGTIASVLTFTSTTSDLYAPIARWKFDEGTGTIASESTGLGVSGTLAGGTSWATGFDGASSVSFSGTSQYVTMGAPGSGALDLGTGSFSVAAWVKYSSTGSNARIVGKGYEDSGPGYAVWLAGDGKVKAAIGTTHSGTSAAETLAFGTQSSFNDNQWHQVTVAVDRETSMARIFVDGIAQNLEKISGTGGTVGPVDLSAISSASLTQLSATKSDKPFTVGSRDGAADFFAGGVDDLRLYNRALSVSDALAIFNVDGDTDGLPDAWEQRYIGTTNQGPGDDADLDGVANGQDARPGPGGGSTGQLGISITTPANGNSY